MKIESIADDGCFPAVDGVARLSNPLVSVIVVNHNYAAYLSQAIESVFAQTYAPLDCIVVDDASTDASPAVIAACAARHPALRPVLLTENLGQTAASLEGLRHARGHYVIFLDADDVLLETCVETHVLVHLSSRVHVGFTSVDMLQVVDDQVVLGGCQAFATYIAGHPESALDPTHRFALGPGASGVALPRAYRVAPTHTVWAWAPTSGNCFRRDALDLFRDGAGLKSLRSQTDLYLALGVNAVCGSILIDEPLFAYRLHRSNAFSRRPELQGVPSYDSNTSGTNATLARRLVVDQLVAQAGRLVQEPWQARAFFRALRQIDARKANGAPGYAAEAVARDFVELAARVGRLRALVFVLRHGMRDIGRILIGLARSRKPSTRRRGEA